VSGPFQARDLTFAVKYLTWEFHDGIQVNPESADEVEMDSMWTRHGVHPGDSILNDKSVSVCDLNANTQCDDASLVNMSACWHAIWQCFPVWQ